jgi:VanZ family protein
MAAVDHVLKLRPVWLLIGYLMVAFVVQQTLTASPMGTGLNFSDKFLHTLGYFLLMGWFVQIYHQPAAKILFGLFFMSMGIGLEFLQGLSGVRHYEVNDMLANGLGVVIAWGLSYSGFSSTLYQFERLVLSNRR